MVWTWQIENAAGKAIEPPDGVSFTSQSDAESWLGEVWRELVDQGGVEASLMEDGRLVYGPMSLLSE